MYKYEMDPTRTVGTTEQTRDVRRMDWCMERWTDGRRKTNIPPTTLCAGGIIIFVGGPDISMPHFKPSLPCGIHEMPRNCSGQMYGSPTCPHPTSSVETITFSIYNVNKIGLIDYATCSFIMSLKSTSFCPWLSAFPRVLCHWLHVRWARLAGTSTLINTCSSTDADLVSEKWVISHLGDVHINGLVQDCRNSSALAMELHVPQTCTKLWIWSGLKFHLSDHLRWVKMTVGQVEYLQDLSDGWLFISDFHISCIGFIYFRQVNGTFGQVIFTIHLPDGQVHSLWNFEAWWYWWSGSSWVQMMHMRWFSAGLL